MSPPGGLSVVVHLLIIFAGAVWRLAKKGMGRDPRRTFFQAPKTGKNRNWKDSAWARGISYMIITSVFFFLSITVAASFRALFEDESNWEHMSSFLRRETTIVWEAGGSQ